MIEYHKVVAKYIQHCLKLVPHHSRGKLILFFKETKTRLMHMYHSCNVIIISFAASEADLAATDANYG